MNDSIHNNIYSAEDIQNYLSGRLTPLQMNAMEKAALDDPFLAEAMEGYAAVQSTGWEKQLGALKESFAQKQNEARVIPLAKRTNNWWKAAAAILVIGTTAAFSYIYFNKDSKQAIAKADVPQTVNAAVDTEPAANGSAEQAAGENAAATPAISVKDYKTIIKDITRLPVEETADSSFVYSPAKTKEYLAADDATAKNNQEAALVKPAPQPSVAANAAPQEILNNNTQGYQKNNAAEFDALKKESKADAGLMARQDAPLNKTFFAQVLGADNTPLPFANVNIKTENFGTYADVKGNFRLLSNDSVLTVEVKAAGFRPQMVTLKSNVQQNRIILTEDNTAFKEKTVISSSSVAKSKVAQKASLVKDSVMNVEPADGWDNYNTYVDNNIDIPDDILKNNIHGEVELSFDVKANGAITNIKVDKSLCGNCDEAAIRMLQQGPQWKVKKGKKGKGKITVHF